MRQDISWKLGFVLIAVAICAVLLSPMGKNLYKTDPLRLGLDLKGGVELLLAPDYRLGANHLGKYGEDVSMKLRQAQINDFQVGFLGTLDNNKYLGLTITFANAADVQRAMNVNAFQPNSRLEYGGEVRNLIVEPKVKGNVVELNVNQSAKDFPEDSLERSKAIIEHRISDQASGMAEAEVRADRSGRLNVQLPGLKTLEQAQELITATGRLTFRINKQIVMDGTDLQEVSVSYKSTGDYAGYAIDFAFKGEGAKLFAKITRENVGKQMGVYLDETELMSPSIRTEIPDGQGFIEMPRSTKEEVTRNALLIKSGALPISLRVIESTQVAPTLGKEIINLSLIGAIVGIVLVILFMLIFYGPLGALADVALLIYGVFFLGVLILMRGVLTLPGLAGLILSFGMAVDANVIIFERIKDELRNGKRVRAAVDAGFHRAFTAIIDSQITTLIAAGVLFFFGTGPVRGFAVTLSIGVILSMITAIVVTRMLIDLVIDRDPDRYAKSFGYKEVAG